MYNNKLHYNLIQYSCTVIVQSDPDLGSLSRAEPNMGKKDLRHGRTAAKSVCDKIATDQQEKVGLYKDLKEAKAQKSTKVNTHISEIIIKYLESKKGKKEDGEGDSKGKKKGDDQVNKNLLVLKNLPALIGEKIW